MQSRINTQPIFILCHARTGSTLLRYILNSHELISCPPETHPIESEIKTRNILQKHTDIEHLKKKTLSDIQRSIDSQMRKNMESQKLLWCDKSISTIEHIDLTIKCFPNARYICLYRNCLDFVHSALEAIKYTHWDGYGFHNYLNSHRNIINSLVIFWCDKVSILLDFQHKYPERCLDIKYESIVNSPSNSIKRIYNYLGLMIEDNFINNIFLTHHQEGNGDYKIKNTIKINNNNINKGRFIFLELIDNKNLLRMNKLLKKLHYPEVNKDWNTILPKNMHYGCKKNKVKLYAINLLNSIFEDFKVILSTKNFSTKNFNCLFQFKDVPLEKYLLSFSPPYVTNKNIPFNLVQSTLTFDFNTFISLLNHQINISEAVLYSGLSVSGDENSAGEFLFLFR